MAWQLRMKGKPHFWRIDLSKMESQNDKNKILTDPNLAHLNRIGV